MLSEHGDPGHIHDKRELHGGRNARGPGPRAIVDPAKTHYGRNEGKWHTSHDAARTEPRQSMTSAKDDRQTNASHERQQGQTEPDLPRHNSPLRYDESDELSKGYRTYGGRDVRD